MEKKAVRGLRAAILASSLALPSAACSDSQTSAPASGKDAGTKEAGPCGSDTFSGVVPCSPASDAAAPAFCSLSMPAEGGISGSLCAGNGAVVCGSSSNADAGFSSLDWLASSSVASHDTQVTITFDSPVPFDQLGTHSARIELTQALPNDGGQLAWKTPVGACSITLTGSFCQAKIQKRVVSGTGSCSQPAAPENGNTEAPITIGSFTFDGG